MPLILADRVRDTTTTTGTGTVTLSGTAPTGYQNFSVIGNGNTTYYTINAGSQWEVGIGTYSSTGPTLARNTVLESSNANALVDFAAGTKDVFVTYPADKSVNYDESNNVGIGTTTPGSKLDVIGSGAFRLDGAGTTTPLILRNNNNAASVQAVKLGFDSSGAIKASINAAVFGNDFMTFNVGSDTERMRIDASGNLAVGTTNPGGWRLKLDKADAQHIALLNTAGNGTRINMADQSWQGEIEQSGGSLLFKAGGTVERMRVSSDGNIGIGTSSPTRRLSIAGGDVELNANVLYLNSGNAFIQGSSTNILFSTNATERARIDGSGNLLVGTTSGSGRLTVVGSSQMVQTYTGASNPFVWGQFDASGNASLNNQANAALLFATNNTERARITNDGSMQLSVGGVSNTHQFLYNENGAEIQLSDATGNGPILLDNSGGLARLLKVGSGGMRVGTTSTGALSLQTADVERMVINSSGNVTANVDIRAPIFYDSNDTSFYLEPDLLSRLNLVRANSIQFSNGQTAITLNDSNYNILRDPTGLPTLYLGGGDPANYYENTNHNFRTRGGSQYGTININGMYAPVFYDYNNSAFYVDPASQSNLFDLIISGTGNKYLQISAPTGNEAMVRYIGATGSSWYVGKRSVTQLVGPADFHFFAENPGATVAGIDTAGNIFASGSMRAPIFYDSNDTGFFVDPASGTNLNGTFVNNGGTAMTAGWNRNMMLSSTFPVLVFNSSNTKYSGIGSDFSTPAAGLYFWVNGSSSDITATGVVALGIDTGNFVTAFGSLRAPIFYDSNDTSYYLDPATTSNLQNVQVFGSLNMISGAPFFISSATGAYQRVDGRNDGSDSRAHWFGVTNTGATSNFRHAWYDGAAYFNITASSSQVVFARTAGVGSLISTGDMRAPIFYDSDNTGYFLDPASSSQLNIVSLWAGSKLHLVSLADGNHFLRYAATGFSGVVVDGPQLAGHQGGELATNMGGDNWSLRWDASGNTFSRTSSRAPIFYDTNNTAFFLDPNGTSNLAGLTVTNTISGSVNGSAGFVAGTNLGKTGPQGFFTTSSWTPADWANLAIGGGGMTIFNTPGQPAGSNFGFFIKTGNRDAGNGWGGIWQDYDGGSLYYGATVDGSVFATWRKTVAYGVNSSGTVFATDFYDNGNTAFYVDPSGTTNLNAAISFSYQGNGNVGGTGSASWHPSGIYSAGYNWLYGGISAGGSDIVSVNGLYANIYYDNNNTAFFVDPAGTSRLNTLNTNLVTGVSGAGVTGLDMATNDNYVSMRVVRNSNTSGVYADGMYIGYANGNGGVTRIFGGGSTGGAFEKFADHSLEQGSFRAPIFYDSNNTGYYLDPTSNTSLRTVGDWRADSAPWTGEFNGKIQYHASNWYFQGANSWEFRRSDTLNAFSVTQGGVATASSDFRAPIFYDSLNTFFYLNPDGYSQINGFGSVNASSSVGLNIMGDPSNGAIMSFHRAGAFAINMGLDSDNVFRIGGWSALGNRLQMDTNGNLTMAGNVTAFSDARLKKDIETIDGALDLVSRMRGVRFTRIENDERNVGVVAQEMLEVLPEVVQQGVGDDDTLSVAYGNIVGVLIEAIKELRAEVAELKGK